MSEAPLLAIDGLSVTYATRSGVLRAIDGIDLSVESGEALALVGESGSGKSTVALAVMGLLGPEAALRGRVAFRGKDLARLSAEERRALRGRDIAIVFQDPFTSLNPSLPIGLQVAEPLVYHRGLSGEAARERAVAALAEVALPDPAGLVSAYPHQLSGGMQQRVLIATALVCDPALVVLDEPTTALDVTVEARILDLLDEIRRRRRLGMLFITHNLGVVNRIADRVCVLYAGRVAELGAKASVLGAAAHPYTKGLLASLPQLAPERRTRRLVPIGGRFPDLTRLPAGCVFAPRCAFSEERCGEPQSAGSDRGRSGGPLLEGSPPPRHAVAGDAPDTHAAARSPSGNGASFRWSGWPRRMSWRRSHGATLGTAPRPAVAAGEAAQSCGRSTTSPSRSRPARCSASSARAEAANPLWRALSCG